MLRHIHCYWLQLPLRFTPATEEADMKRYVVEGKWSGYHSGQQRVVYREVIKPNKKSSERWKNLHSIRYTDGTLLCISIREAKPRERIEQKLSYKSLVRDALYSGQFHHEVKSARGA
jgi:hypothetical protein